MLIPRTILALLFILAGRTTLLSQDPVFETISSPPGFDMHEIGDIRQDPSGYLWLATGSGLLRFDGYNWIVFQRNPKNPNSLAGDNIRTVCPTRDGLIWVGGWNAGLDCLNPATGKITHHTLVKREKYVFAENSISALLEDHLGNLWVGTPGGLYLLEKSSGKFIPYLSDPKDPTSLSFPVVNCVYEDRQGTIWVGTGDLGSKKVMEGGLNRLDRATGRFTRYLHSPNDTNSLVENRILSLFEDSRGTFWVGSGGDGLHTLDRKTGRFTRYPYQEAHPERLGRPVFKEKNLRNFFTLGIQFFREDFTGAIWIGTIDSGLSRYEPSTGLVTRYQTPADGLPDFSLYSGHVARDGTLWIGTIPGHLVKVTVPNPVIKKVKMNSGVHYFEEDAAGDFWIATLTGMILTEPASNAAHQWFAAAAKQTRLPTDHVTRLNSDRAENRWISTWTDGLYQFEKSTGRFFHYVNDSLDAASLSPGEITGFYEDKSGIKWVLTAGGLDKIDPISGKFRHYRHDDRDTTSIRSSSALAVKEDRTGKFWVGTNGGGLNLMDRKTGKFRHFLDWSVVTELVEDAAGTLWVASTFGLHYYDPKRGIFIPFLDPGSGKALPFVKALVEDDQGNLWAAVSNGIAAISRDRKSMRLFGANFGIYAGEDFFFGGSRKRRDGSIYFASIDKYFHFQPETLLKQRFIAPVLNLTAFRIHNRVATMQARSTELTFDQNVFSIDFAAVDYRHPELQSYTYKLENYDTDWHPVGADRTANYSGIPPGTYQFRVKAANSDGIWVEKSIRIRITPPWWQTGWAYAFYFVIAAVLFFGGWQILLRRERANHILRMKESESQQLAEVARLKSDLFANVSHEFRTPLTLILSPLEHWITSLPADHSYVSQFTSMHRNARKLLHLVNELLDLTKLEAGKMQIETQPGDLVHFTKKIADSFIPLAESQGIVFQTNLPEENLWLLFDPVNLEKILTNLLSNAFKFTSNGGQILLELSVKRREEWRVNVTERPVILVEFRVIDNGPGIPAEHLERVFERFHQVDQSLTRGHAGTGIGLALAREVVDLHGGAITVSSTEGEGSTFVVTLPLEKLHSAHEVLIKNKNLDDDAVAIPSTNPETLDPESVPYMKFNQDEDAPVVLVVEDNADLRSFIVLSLTEYSAFRILQAVDGKEGYEMAQEQVPDLVISDIMMPKMDGINLCKLLKSNEKTSHIPVILLTAKASIESKIQGLQTRADDYLAKPFELRELLARINNLIEVRKILRERYTRQIVLQPENIAISSLDEHFLNRCMAIIHDQLSNVNFGVEMFGREIGMSRMQLYRKMQALTGQSPSDFIRYIRLQRAAQLLAANSGTVSQIADQVGFGSHSYFSKCFQDQYGKSPSAYVAELERNVRTERKS